MNKTFGRTLAASTVAAALAASMSTTPSAVADQADPKDARTSKLANFGFKGTASGARLITNNVEMLNVNDSLAPLWCTRRLNREALVTSQLTAPEDSLIQLEAVTNQSRTYRSGDRVGVRSISSLAPLQIGDTTGQTTGGQPTPEIRIDSVTTVADAFHDKTGYGHKESITDLDLTIDLVPGQEADQPLQDLLKAIRTERLGPVLEVLDTTVGGAPIKIPGLGSIALGKMRGKARDNRAESHASAIEILVDASGENQRLILGGAHSWIGGPTPTGVFRSVSSPMRVDVAEGMVRLGRVRPQVIRCEGTGGREKVRKLASASVVLPQGMLAKITDVGYRSMGDQRRKGSARGYQVSTIGAFTIPALDLVIEGISSRSGVRITDLDNVDKKALVSVAKIMHQGQEIPVPRAGSSRAIDGVGFVETGVISDGSRYGQRVTALRLTLTEFGPPVVFELGIAAVRISPF